MEEIVCDDLLGKIIQFTRSKRFTSRIDDFIYENLKEFHNISECKEYNSEEFPLHYTTKFQSYRQMIDEMFDQFAKENGLSTREVFSCFRDSADNKFTVLFEEHEHKWFVDLVMSWNEFDEFVKVMLMSAKKRQTFKK